MYSIAVSFTLACVRSAESSKVYEDFGKTFIKVVRQLAHRERGDAISGVSPYDALSRSSLSSTSLGCAFVCTRVCQPENSLYVSHLENRLNILSIRGNKNKFFSFRDLISCFCWVRVSADVRVCVSLFHWIWTRFLFWSLPFGLPAVSYTFSIVCYCRRRRLRILLF